MVALNLGLHRRNRLGDQSFHCRYLSPDLPRRGLKNNRVGMGVVTFLTDMGLFIGRSQAFVDYMTGLAADADAGARQCCAATDFSIFPPEQGVSVRWALC
jgi:hypothetical protein